MEKDSGALNRNQVIMTTGVIGIVVNVILAAVKVIIGTVVNSIAIVLDGVNNLSDAMSSFVTIIGNKLANKKPDKAHPLGHGRIEYISGLVVAAIIIYAGITAAVESVKKIINPSVSDYSKLSLAIIVMAVVVKLILGNYVKKKGLEVNSSALVASGSDALFDAILSISVLISALVYIFAGVNIEAYVGLLIAVMIVKAGYNMIKDTVSDILGRRVDRDLIHSIKETICEEDMVNGAYDLILHNYGPDRFLGSVHVEIDENISAKEIDSMTRRLMEAVYKRHGVILEAIGVYSQNHGDDVAVAMRTKITEFVMEQPGVLQIHGFFIDLQKKHVSFDVILDFEIEDRQKVCNDIVEGTKKVYPDFEVEVTLDLDI